MVELGGSGDADGGGREAKGCQDNHAHVTACSENPERPPKLGLEWRQARLGEGQGRTEGSCT